MMENQDKIRAQLVVGQPRMRKAGHIGRSSKPRTHMASDRLDNDGHPPFSTFFYKYRRVVTVWST